MNYEMAWKALRGNFIAALKEPLELSKEEGDSLKKTIVAALLTMDFLEKKCAKEKDDRATDRQRVEN